MIKKNKTGSLPRVLFVQVFHESLDQGKSLTGADQQVPFHGTLQINPIRHLLPKVKICVIGLSRIPYQR